MSPQDAFWKTNRGSRTLSLGRTPEHRRRIVCSLRNSMPWILHDPSYSKQFVFIFTAGKGSKIHKSRSVTFYLPSTQFFFNFKVLFLGVRLIENILILNINNGLFICAMREKRKPKIEIFIPLLTQLSFNEFKRYNEKKYIFQKN